MPVLSAGLLMCRFFEEKLQFFLIHPGGPFYSKKDKGVWSIPKGIIENDEELFPAAKREFKEETGLDPNGEFHALGSIKSKSGKIVHVWTFLGSWDEKSGIVSNTFPMEWPPRSGRTIQVPEADRAAWLNFEQACDVINPAQIPLLERAKKVYSEK